jgi:hypothetical protein
MWETYYKNVAWLSCDECHIPTECHLIPVSKVKKNHQKGFRTGASGQMGCQQSKMLMTYPLHGSANELVMSIVLYLFFILEIITE